MNLISDGLPQALSDDRARAVAAPPALESRDLEVAYRVRGIWRPVLRGVSFAIAPGESYGLVGESGCGKSTAAFAIVRYLPRNGRVSSRLDHGRRARTCSAMSERDAAHAARARVSMVYQNPRRALNPTIRVGDQVAEVFTIARRGRGRGARPRARRCCARSRSPTRRGSCAAIRTSSRAACSSAS